MNTMQTALTDDPVTVVNPTGRSCVVVVCEHASRIIPAAFGDLGLGEDARQSHIAWDPGAMGMARGLSQRFDATLVASNVSRLIYDCNRPPSSPGAMPARSEAIDIPGNIDLTPAQRNDRTTQFYDPFRACLAAAIAATSDPVIVTLHSFTQIYHGQSRAVEIGILHDMDARLADAMMHCAAAHTGATVERNAPYGPEHGVTHTLQEHAIKAGHLNVMLEIRNDLIKTAQQQDDMAQCLGTWVTDALLSLGVTEGLQCWD